MPGGGQALLWQHLFWMWGHPWVYAIVLPAHQHGVAMHCRCCCRRPLVGYAVVALATIMTMVLGFGVWLHHMFATGLPNIALSFFSAVSIHHRYPERRLVVRVACHAYGPAGRSLTRAFLFFAGFIVVFVIGGVSGFMTGAVPVDWQLTDTYFVVGSHSLCSDRLESVRGDGRHLFLVPQDDRPLSPRAPRAVEFLVNVRRLSISAFFRCTFLA